MSPLRGEDALTARISAAARRLVPRPAKKATRLVLGIGDDAAVVDLERGRYVFTTDTLVEEIDFLRNDRPESVGRRAAAANLSDLAAMGADPEGYLLTIGLGPGRGAAYAEGIARGVLAKMRPFGATLWGGDLSRAPATFVTICAAGTAPHPVERAGAAAGDRLFATGRPGSAAEALARRRSRRERAVRDRRREAPYLDPEPRVAFARELARRRWATSMIDVSDGIGKDAHRLARASRVRLVFSGVSPAVLAAPSDDFELLFTAPPRRSEAILGLGRRLSTPVSEVGRVERGRGIFVEARGRRRPVPERGYDHLA
jgi:thiamine-monophosphate kinase